MKVAYHFACDEIEERYDRHFYNVLFNKFLALNHPFISSKILIGDLCISSEIIKKIDPDAFLNELIQTHGDTWKRITVGNAKLFLQINVFIICFETIQRELAERIHESLASDPNYMGAFEIDNTIELQWWLYGECIGPKYRILNRDLYVLVDGEETEEMGYAHELKGFFEKFPFDQVKIENAKYRYSLFDGNHNYANAKRAAVWKKSIDSLFSTVTDEITGRLIDPAPELTDKLWAITQAFDNAETGEQYAQAMTSCRRVFQYVSDCLFPATSELADGHSLKKDKYKNRLMEFANREFKSDTNIEFIVINASSLYEEWNKLYELSNKGVHSEPHRQECRRCIIRTILLLHDLISLKSTPFDVNVIMDKLINHFTRPDK